MRWIRVRIGAGVERDQDQSHRRLRKEAQGRPPFVQPWLRKNDHLLPILLSTCNRPFSRLFLIRDNKIHFSRWSYGCLLAEVLTGSKLFSATDKMASVLKPRQLLEMKIGEAEIRYDGLGEQQFFQDAKDLITKYAYLDN